MNTYIVAVMNIYIVVVINTNMYMLLILRYFFLLISSFGQPAHVQTGKFVLIAFCLIDINLDKVKQFIHFQLSPESILLLPSVRCRASRKVFELECTFAVQTTVGSWISMKRILSSTTRQEICTFLCYSNPRTTGEDSRTR
jgi:hypothetical protein